MPRVSQKAKEEGEVVKRAPRKTATRAPRKTATKKVVASENTVETVVRRKAPTRVAEEEVRSPKTKREKSLYVSGALFGLGLLAAALIGYSDKGQINPSVVIAERNARLSAGVADATTQETQGQMANQVIPVQNTSNLPNGGLVPSKKRAEPAPVVEEVATSTASSTEAVATTSEDGTGEAEGVPEDLSEEVIPETTETESPVPEEAVDRAVTE